MGGREGGRRREEGREKKERKRDGEGRSGGEREIMREKGGRGRKRWRVGGRGGVEKGRDEGEWDDIILHIKVAPAKNCNNYIA